MSLCLAGLFYSSCPRVPTLLLSQSCGLLILYLSCSSPEAPFPRRSSCTHWREGALCRRPGGIRDEGHTQPVSPAYSRGTLWEHAVHLVSASLCICQGSILRVCGVQCDFPPQLKQGGSLVAEVLLSLLPSCLWEGAPSACRTRNWPSSTAGLPLP